MENNYVQRIEVTGLWGKHKIVWDELYPDVNILVGINGSGKSTLLNIIRAVLSASPADKKLLERIGVTEVMIQCNNCKASYKKGAFNFSSNTERLFMSINTIDAPMNKSKLLKDESPLTQELRQLILQTGANSFNDYRLRATMATPKQSKEIGQRIRGFFSLIDELFCHTGKRITIDDHNNIVFERETDVIQLEQLSSGEKQLLIILFKVFLMDNAPFILLMDDPEIALHISWQHGLIETIRSLNPNCQLIITTHSPSIFGKGWGDHITFMEKLFQE